MLRAQLLNVAGKRGEAKPAAAVIEQIERWRGRTIGIGASEIPQFPATTVVTP